MTPRERVLIAFDRLNKEGGGRQYVTLADVRKRAGLGRKVFDSALRDLREAWVLTLSPDQTSGKRLVYVQRREGSTDIMPIMTVDEIAKRSHRSAMAEGRLLPFDTGYQFQRKGPMAKAKAKKAKRRKTAPKKAGIKTFKELEMRLALKKHGKPTVRKFKLS